MWLGFDTVFHPVAAAFNYDRLGVMKKAIEDGGGNGAIAVEDRRLLCGDTASALIFQTWGSGWDPGVAAAVGWIDVPDP